MEQFNDAYYIKKVKEGNRAAFSFIVHQYQEMVFSLCFQLLKNQDDAKDLAQDVFVKIYSSLNKFKGTAQFSTWIYRITYNMGISKLRKKNILNSTDNEQELERAGGFELHATEKTDEDFEVNLLQSAIHRLNEEEQVLITLHYYKEQSMDEIAKIMGLSISNVKVKLFRIRKKMKQWMDTEKALHYN